ncbi:MAG: hypothetical protein CHACPFDD_01164 [Phycisphaerae bacterium]|nr:hypothetical protein [Phycisphaerae bacterium]
MLGEPAHPGWNNVRFDGRLTVENPTYWSAYSGKPGVGLPISRVQPFGRLDPVRNGRPDPEGSGDRVVRGMLILWAVDANGRQIRWNHLTGSATLVDYGDERSWKYAAWAFQSNTGTQGEIIGTPGVLSIGGEYQSAPGRLLLEFFAEGAVVSSDVNGFKVGSTELTLAVVSNDLASAVPTTTRLDMPTWNQNEVRFSWPAPCIAGWCGRPLSSFSPLYTRSLLGTDAGKIRINGIASSGNGCAGIAAAMLGVAAMQCEFKNSSAPAGAALIGQDLESAKIVFTP